MSIFSVAKIKMTGQDQKPEQETRGLTQSQMSMWTGQMLEPENPLYNMVYTFDLRGEIKTDHFQKAFQGLVKRSDALRTVFEGSINEPRQRVLDEIEYELEILEDFDKTELENWIKKRSQKNLDLAKCTFDSALIKLSGERFIWFFNEHHLTTDARSSSLIFKKMSELYAASVSGDFEKVPPFPAYRNYITHEKLVRTSSEREAVKKYWQEKADALPDPPKLYGRENSKKETFSERIVVDLGVERSRALINLTNESDLRAFTTDLSLFNIFATILFAFLCRVSGQNDLAIGTPVHNRPTPDFKQTPGLFIEFFPFACEVASEDTFQTLFKRISRETFEFLRNARSGASTPATNRKFNVILNYIDTDFPDFNGIPGEAIWRHPDRTDASHHLRLHVYNDKKAASIKLFFDLNRGVFNEPKLKTVPAHFLKILDSFIEDRVQGITENSLLSGAEYQNLVVDFNRETEKENPNVLELFRRQVKQNPERIAIKDKSQSLSFAELDERSNKLANLLIEKGINAGDRVSLHLKRSADLIVGILGTLKSGGVYVPISSSNPKKRVAEKVKLSESSMVLTHGELSGNLEGSEISIVDFEKIERQSSKNPERKINPKNLAYIMFTSGSTGVPKGVKISHGALANYINAAGEKYCQTENPTFPLFTTIDFDLTVTSIFLPLTFGGNIEVYEESEAGTPDLAVLDVVEDNKADVIKLTPSHLSLIKDKDLSGSKIKTMIVGGEDLKTALAESISKSFPGGVKIYNEYGPTEAAVGCILHEFDAEKDRETSVPVGRPFANTSVYILDEKLNPVPPGVAGKLYLSGKSLADGYWKNPELTAQKFIRNPFEPNAKMYDTGDLARLNERGEIEYLGRRDEQVKIGGIRIELGEIETALAEHTKIETCVVELVESKKQKFSEDVFNCQRCGLPSNYPTAEFDEAGVCNFCSSFENYQQKVEKYFKTPDDLRELFEDSRSANKGEYDCIMLLSGGKDSTYALARLVRMNVRVLAYTLDNGYISVQAKENIKRVCEDLGVEHIFGETPAMNDIFVDSLVRYKNVCNGCFKTIYTLSTRLALEKNIPFIVTGLSRGQFFETRLTEELFWKKDVDVAGIDRMILDARKSYHRTNDAANRLLDASVFENDSVFERVRFIDFYRYFDVGFEEMMKYLNERLPWIRPTDTGRSTNCLINQVGIYVHKKELGYSNYAFPYSWDVRIGHKTREVSLDEINEEIDEREVGKIIDEIGYSNMEKTEKRLVAFYTASKEIAPNELRQFLANKIPAYMIPNSFIRMDEMPLTANGKVDRRALREISFGTEKTETEYAAPENEFEEILQKIWSEVLQIEKIGVNDNFLHLGGNSLAAIRIMTRANDAFDLSAPLSKIFEMPTIKTLSAYFEKTILTLLDELSGQQSEK